jgi:dynein heavy chain
MQDVNNILNAGEIIGLLGIEDHEEINYELEKQMRAEKLPGRPLDLIMQRCKRNLHIILALSPAGNELSLLFRKYPSLVNCASIDWFLNWPAEALLAVSRAHLIPHASFLKSLDLELINTPK